MCLVTVTGMGERRGKEGKAMQFVICWIKTFLVSEDGPTATEYAVMLALIAMVCLAAIGGLGTKVSTLFSNADSVIPAGTAGPY